jgi:ArsR family transcriptional regulator
MQVNDDFLEFYSLMCSTISKPARLKIIATIGDGKKNVSELQKALKIPMSNLSNHLNGLYRAGVLGKEKQGNYVYYYLNEPGLLKGIDKMQNIFKTISTKRHSA